jgi:hypothetical protein
MVVRILLRPAVDGIVSKGADEDAGLSRARA